jgi:hypothetical protein
MATSPDAKVIDRESSKKGILGRYLDKEKAGGTFDAYAAGTNTMILGVQSPFGFTQKSRTYTIEPGFSVGTRLERVRGENFNEKALNYADALKVNTVKYTSNSFAR